MRTFGRHHFSIALAFAGSLAAAPLAAAQGADPAPTPRFIPARCTGAACGDDVRLAIVAALYPYYDGAVRGPGVLTLVIENRGDAPAPISTLEVAPVTRVASYASYASYTAARRASVDALMPGERTVVQIPLELDANGGAPCISIAVSPSILPTAARTQVFASSARAAEPPLEPPPFVSFVGDDF
jgi:hypothetical protein